MMVHTIRVLAVAGLLAFAAGCSSSPAVSPTAAPPTVAPASTATAAPAAAPTTVPPTALPVLRVGLDGANPPWAYADGKGNLAGIDAELLVALARELGVRIELTNLAPHLLATELSAKRVDLVAAGLVATPERAQALALSRPYFKVEQAVVVRSTDAATGAAALKGRAVGVQIGSTAVAEVRKAGGEVRAYDDLAIALAALGRGEVQAVLGDKPGAAAFLRAHPELGLKMAGMVGGGQPVVLALARDNAALLARVNAALDALDRRGDLAALEKRWLE